MLVVLLLISQISCDWVEISQNHYRKEPPSRTTPHAINIRYEEKTNDKRFHKNHSVIEKQWNKAIIDRVTHVGNIKRVQDPSVKTPSIQMRPNENLFHKSPTDKIDRNNQHHNINSEHTRVSIYNPLEAEEPKRIEATHRVATLAGTKSSNKEHVNNSPLINNSNVKNIVKSSSSQVPLNRRKFVIEKLNNSRIKGYDDSKIHREQESDRESDEDDIAKEDTDHDVGNRKYITNFQRIANNGQNKFLLSNDLRDKSNILSNTSFPQATRTGEIFGPDNKKYLHNIRDFDKENLNGFNLNGYKLSNASITTTHSFHNIRLDKIHLENNDDQLSKLDFSSSSKFKSIPHIDLNINIPENKNDNIDKNSIVPKAETLSGMWKLMKVVSDTIYKNTHRTVKSKIKYLESLKSTILSSIEEQVENIWPDDVEHRTSRKKRARNAQARGHVEFPSSESTLMTISFLTFAVFLIKLVLQVIHTYKNKTMMVSPAVFAAVGRAAAAIRSQN